MGKPNKIPAFKMPFYPLASYLSLAFLACVVGIMAYMPDLRFSVYIAPVWLLCLYIGYKIKTSVPQA